MGRPKGSKNTRVVTRKRVVKKKEVVIEQVSGVWMSMPQDVTALRAEYKLAKLEVSALTKDVDSLKRNLIGYTRLKSRVAEKFADGVL